MIHWGSYLWSGAALLAGAVLFWLVSLRRDDVSIVDSLWSLMFMAVALVYAGLEAGDHGPRTTLVLSLVAVWALRLSAYITWRNHGEPEDRRYREIREKNQPGFRYKSLYIVFGLQALLAWIIALPLAGAISGTAPWGLLDGLGVLLWIAGMVFEAGGDWQLARFKRNRRHHDLVLRTGLWRYTRHPNYFGNFLIWWGFYLLALSAGAWWTVVSPLLMTFLLLKVSGVALLEKDIGERRPEYADYVRHTNAFFPGPQKG